MQRTARIAAAATFSSVLVAGTVAGFMLTGGTARAQTSGGECSLDGTTSTITTAVDTCNIPAQSAGTTTTTALTNPFDDVWIQAVVTNASTATPASESVVLSWTMSCTDSDGSTATNSDTAGVTVTVTDASENVKDIGLPSTMPDPATCNVEVTAADTGIAAGNVVALTLDYNVNPSAVASTTSASATATATATATASASTSAPVTVHQVRGFDGACVDDFGNSSSDRAKIGIWTCSSTDTAQSWSYSGDELKIHGDMCVNAKGNGKSGSKLILWKCTGSANEVFVHNSKQEYVEKAGGWKYCIDDPGYSTKNGTQLFVYSCNNGPNQHWALP
jgi:ricin-type beta-trefoil lectin protein